MVRVLYRAGGCEIDDVLGAAGLTAGGGSAAHPGAIWCAGGHPLRKDNSSTCSGSGMVKAVQRVEPSNRGNRATFPCQ